MRFQFHDIEVKRKTLAKILATVFVLDLLVMGGGALYSYQQAPPIPDEIQGPDGETIVTEEEVTEGKAQFQSNGPMNHGSILGNGAYYGVDYTANALALKVQYAREYYVIIASGAWNFLGAGVLGFFINLPLINYYEHGTY